uniref:Uncharacterized protein n=1 Tax=Heterorhabditis bacteriophora TaxID=37862 RepID=A0A1I7WZN7_HETBA
MRYSAICFELRLTSIMNGMEELLSSPIHPRKISVGDELFETPRPGEMIKEAVQMAFFNKMVSNALKSYQKPGTLTLLYYSYMWKRRDRSLFFSVRLGCVMDKRYPCISISLWILLSLSRATPHGRCRLSILSLLIEKYSRWIGLLPALICPYGPSIASRLIAAYHVRNRPDCKEIFYYCSLTTTSHTQLVFINE